MNKILVTTNLSKVYRRDSSGVQGVENVNLEIDKGTIVALIGENGAGKSTLIKMLTTVLKPDTGTISINGIEVASKTDKTIKRLIGYSSETLYFYSKLTGYEIARFVGGLYDQKLHVGENKVFSFFTLAQRLKLEPHLNKLVSSYSNGTLRKLSICMAIAFEQQLIILDEPTNGLDPDSYLELRRILQEAKDCGRTILISTHQLSMAEEIATKIAICKKGSIHYFEYDMNYGSVEELYEKYS